MLTKSISRFASNEMEVTAGLIQKLADEHASRYAALESRMDSLEKEWREEGNPV